MLQFAVHRPKQTEMHIAVLTAVYQVRMVVKRVVSVMFEDKYTVVCQQTITDDGSKQLIIPASMLPTIRLIVYYYLFLIEEQMYESKIGRASCRERV